MTKSTFYATYDPAPSAPRVMHVITFRFALIFLFQTGLEFEDLVETKSWVGIYRICRRRSLHISIYRLPRTITDKQD